MKLRIKYTKTGPLRFISHLDVMRFFQKAIKRAGFDVSYTKGFSPHQIISFAAPMPLGMTSEGEYFDGEFNSVTNTLDMMDRINAVMPEWVRVLDIIRLEDKAKPSMALVAASDYIVYDNPQSGLKTVSRLIEKGIELPDSLVAIKKTKSGEKEEDIRPFVYGLGVCDTKTGAVKRWILNPKDRADEIGDRIEIVTPLDMDEGLYMLLSAGSMNNLKPEALLSGLAGLNGVPYEPGCERTHRIDTYMNKESEDTLNETLNEAKMLVSLKYSGERF